MPLHTRMLSAFALSGAMLAIPATAQQISGQEANQAASAVFAAFNKVLHAKDASGIAALYTEDAIRVAPNGPEYGRAEIQKDWTEIFRVYEPDFARLDRVAVIGNDVFMSVGDWAGALNSPNGPVLVKGYAVWDYTREAGHWRIRTETVNLNQPPSPEQTKQ